MRSRPGKKQTPHSTPRAKLPAQAQRHAVNTLYRDANGHGPQVAPEIVHDVLRGPGQPMPRKLRQEMETRFAHDFTDVRVHTDKRAGASAEAVAANAYTVGRQIVFAHGYFEPGSTQGRRLLVHELAHVTGHQPGTPTPTTTLRVSAPTEAAERHAESVSQGSSAPAAERSTASSLFRQPAAQFQMTGLRVNHPRVTVPPTAGLAFRAITTPANATNVSFSIVGVNATIDPGTTVNNTSGLITVAASQTGGSANVATTQTVTVPGGSNTVTATAPFNFTAIPSAIVSTSAALNNTAGFYGGDFTHTFSSPNGGATALERSHVNEQFPGAGGTNLRLTGPLGTINVTINDPALASSGWDLNASGTMAGPDHVTWSHGADARPFVTNASHPAPNPALPQAWTATQNFRNLSFPGNTYAPAVTTTHRRAIEDRNNRLKGVTSANGQQLVEDYEGPTVFRRCRASVASIRRSLPTSPGGAPADVDRTTISVDAEGQVAQPTFSINAPNLGCTIDSNGVLTPGEIAGTVTVRAGNAVNFDETVVTIAARPSHFARLTSDRTPAQIIEDNDLAQRSIDVAALRRLNPEIGSTTTITAGTVVWFVARAVSANATGLEAIALRHFGDEKHWPKLWSFNPHIRNPRTIQPATRIFLQSEADRALFSVESLL